ncbi:hypothetical protein ACP275_10G153200 [Erythranthe tilingii]
MEHLKHVISETGTILYSENYQWIPSVCDFFFFVWQKKYKSNIDVVHARYVFSMLCLHFSSNKDPGESIIRPSSRGLSDLTLTLKIYDGVYANIDIVEGGKEHKNITSLFRIGKTLKIGEDTFEDLDEVMDRYVYPLVANLKAMLNYRKFRSGSKTEVDALLKKEKSENPKMVVYWFRICYEHPGSFLLSHIRNSNKYDEYVTLYPKGFKFRKTTFDDIGSLMKHFQTNINKPFSPAKSIGSAAAMVPMRESNWLWRER